MTIFDYTNLPTITVPYILRDEDNLAVGVYVTNQETKEQFYCLLERAKVSQWVDAKKRVLLRAS